MPPADQFYSSRLSIGRHFQKVLEKERLQRFDLKKPFDEVYQYYQLCSFNRWSQYCIFIVTLLEFFWTIVNLGCWIVFLDNWKWVVNSECVKWICIFDLSIVSSFMPTCIMPVETWFCMLMYQLSRPSASTKANAMRKRIWFTPWVTATNNTPRYLLWMCGPLISPQN